MPLPLIPESHPATGADPGRKLRLLEVVRRRARERRYSRRTEEAYVNWIRRFVRFHGRRHPKDMGETEVRDFLSSLAVERGVSASTQNQALAALRFLYDAVLARPLSRADDFTPAPRREREPTVSSEHEVRVLLARLSRVPRLCAELMYGSGLRVSECLALRVKDVDLDRLEIVVRGGKGDRDRRTPLAPDGGWRLTAGQRARPNQAPPQASANATGATASAKITATGAAAESMATSAAIASPAPIAGSSTLVAALARATR